MLAAEGVRFTPAAMAAAGIDVNTVVKRTLLAGLAFHGYQQVSYMILSKARGVRVWACVCGQSTSLRR